MKIEDEIAKLPEDIKVIGNALVRFAENLHPGYFIKKDSQWVYEPNFVTFSIHSQQADHLNITLSLRGNPHEFAEEDKKVLPFPAQAQGGYSRCKITTPKQLKAAVCHIDRAYLLWKKGRTRNQTTPCLIEK